jgi:PAS domain S-box-containing protein
MSTIWETYHWYILASLAVIILQAVMIASLIIERSRRRQTEKRHALAAAAGGVGVWDWNLETNAMYVDPLLKGKLGYEDHEIRNHIDSWSRFVHPDDSALVAERVKDHLEGRSPAFEVEHRMRHRDGSVRWFLARGTVVRRNGRAIRMTGTDTDITDRKRAEQALDDTRAELARVSRLTTLGEFAAAMAHEVRQPLTAIIVNAKVCLRWLGTESPDRGEIEAALWDIADAGKRAEQLMHRNRELFRHRSVRKEPLDINSVVREVAALAATRLSTSRITLVTSLASDLPLVPGDRIELQQVLLNLLGNAIDALAKVEPAARRVEIGTRRTSDGEVRVAVVDNGVGLGEVDMQRMFSLSYTTKANGTGIGLSLSRSIVDAHGGQLWAEQNRGSGATFAFTLPVVKQPGKAAASSPIVANT